MQKFFYFILVGFCIQTNGQITYDGPADGSVAIGITLNTDTFSLGSFSYHEFIFINKFEPESNYEELVFPDSSYPERVFYYLQSYSNGITDSLIISQSFEGIPQTNYNPPDDYIAAGPNHLVMVVNNLFRIYDKSGNVEKTISAADWYSSLVGGARPIDPKVFYDHFDNRWVMVWIYIDRVQLRSYIFISVSDDGDPNGIWFNWVLPADVNGNTPANNWADYEGVGFDDKAVYITSNQFSYSYTFEYVKMRIIDKADIYINSDPGMVKWKDIWNITVPGASNSASYLRPARMQDTLNVFYFFYLPNAGGNFCAVYKIENSLTNPVLTATAYPITPFAISPDARQLGGSVLIDGGFSALRNEPVFKDGILHAVHCIRNPNDASLSSLHYLAVAPVNNSVVKDIAIGDDKHFFFYPALAVDKDNNVIISYSRSSTEEYAGGYFTAIPEQSGLPTGSIELKRGNDYFARDNGTGESRWGDYSGAWIDPSDSVSFWICTEYVEALNTWGTWVGKIKFDIPVSTKNIMNEIPNNYVLNQNYPNPFNPSTKISWQSPVGSWQTLMIYDVLGNEVATLVDEYKPAGEYEIEFNATKLQSGVYFYQLKAVSNGTQAGSFIQTKKLLLIK